MKERRICLCYVMITLGVVAGCSPDPPSGVPPPGATRMKDAGPQVEGKHGSTMSARVEAEERAPGPASDSNEKAGEELTTSEDGSTEMVMKMMQDVEKMDAEDRRPDTLTYVSTRTTDWGALQITLLVRNRRVFPRGALSWHDRMLKLEHGGKMPPISEFSMAADHYVQEVTLSLGKQKKRISLVEKAIFFDVVSEHFKYVSATVDRNLYRVSLAFRGGDGGTAYQAGIRVKGNTMDAVVTHNFNDREVDLDKMADAINNSSEKGAVTWRTLYGK